MEFVHNWSHLKFESHDTFAYYTNFCTQNSHMDKSLGFSLVRKLNKSFSIQKNSKNGNVHAMNLHIILNNLFSNTNSSSYIITNHFLCKKIKHISVKCCSTFCWLQSFQVLNAIIMFFLHSFVSDQSFSFPVHIHTWWYQFCECKTSLIIHSNPLMASRRFLAQNRMCFACRNKTLSHQLN